MSELLALWLALGLMSFAAFCLYVTIHGTIEGPPFELRVAHWCGRGILVLAAIASLLAGSKGLLILARWSMQ
jgi:hypothetical protein